jgi:hypothetical protein
MAQLRVKIELNKGRHGVPIHKLAHIAEEAEKFFKMLSSDIHLGSGEWIADNFKNGSLAYDISFVGQVTDGAIKTGQKALDLITNPKTKPDDLKLGIRKATFLQFAKIASPIEEDDFVSVGLYNGGPKPEMRELSKKRYLEIEREITRTIEQYGGIQGIITAFFKEANLFWVRSLSTGERVSCIFPPGMYNRAWKLLESKDAIVNLEGWMILKNGKIEHLKVTTLSQAVEYQDGDLEAFFGCDPDFTDGLTTEEYIDDLRGGSTEEYLEQIAEDNG